MKTKIIISVFIALCAVFATLPTHAQKNKEQPATHMWLQNYENLLYIPVRSVEQCLIMAKQASNLNSSTALCYMNEKLLREIKCTKPLKKSAEPSCS